MIKLKNVVKFALIFLTVIFGVNAQKVGALKKITDLPKKLQEVSGVAYSKALEKIYMVNDSGNNPEIYVLDSEKKLVERIINVTNAENNDWEDMTIDEDGNLYVGDFGNNQSKRKDLAILKFNKSDLQLDKVKASLIRFSLEDQTKFPPKRKHRNFDIEAFIARDGYFYMFTRNRSSKFDGISKIYKLPNVPGEQVARLVGTFYSGKDSSDCQITSAAVDHKTGKIALLSYNKVWILSNYSSEDFSDGIVQKIRLHHTSQKEGVTFYDSNTLFICDERSRGKGRNLYKLKLK